MRRKKNRIPEWYGEDLTARVNTIFQRKIALFGHGEAARFADLCGLAVSTIWNLGEGITQKPEDMTLRKIEHALNALQLKRSIVRGRRRPNLKLHRA